LLEWATDLESHVGDLLKRCGDAGAAARAEHDAALGAQRDAASAARRAADGAALDAARERERDAARTAADCEAALDLLGEADGRLRCALGCVRALPAGLDEAYETAARITAAGGVLPHSGDFIAPGTPEITTEGTAV
jgi:hypothetical protein